MNLTHHLTIYCDERRLDSGANGSDTERSVSPSLADFRRERRTHVLLYASALALAFLSTTLFALVLPSVSSAEVTHLYDPTTSTTFGSIAGGLGLAIDQSNGDVYVAQLNNDSIRKFTATGEPVAGFGGGSGEIPFGGPWGLAVDQNSHDLYVSNGGSAVYKFDSEGNPVASFGSAGQLGVENCIGVAVDPTNGDLYVANAGGKVEVFTSSGSPISEFSTGPVTAPLGIAVDASGHVYVDGGAYIGGGPGLERFDESGTSEGVVEEGAFQSVAVDPATQDIYTSQSGELAEYSPGGNSLISRFGGGVVNDAWGVGVNEATGDVYTATYYGGSVDAFGPAVIIPNVTSDPPSAATVDHTTATLTGYIDPAGGPAVTECAIEYGTSTEYSSGKVPCETSTPISAPSEVIATLTGLQPLTSYHYRFVARNENGTNYGQDQTVEPPAVFAVTTSPAMNITSADAGLTGSFQVDPEGGETHYYFEWGLSSTYGSKTPEASVASDGLHEVSDTVSAFSFYTLYHYRIVATDALGTTYGPDRTLRTEPPGLPQISGTAASGVSPEGAIVEAEVDPEFGPTVVRFEYGPTLSYGSKTPPSEPLAEDGVDHQVRSSIGGLRPGETYHYRVLAVNFSGSTVGPDQTFNTTSAPTISTTGSSAISDTAVTLKADITPGFSSTTYHFEYGTTSGYGRKTAESPPIGADNSDHAVSSTVSGLLADTTYHYRIVATNGIGSAGGPDFTFTTSPAPEEKKGGAPTRCSKKGENLKHGRCVKKVHPHHNHRRRHRQHMAGGGAR
jgi:hypothetical protein